MFFALRNTDGKDANKKDPDKGTNNDGPDGVDAKKIDQDTGNRVHEKSMAEA